MPHQPLPGNEDLAHLIPKERPGSSWDIAVMVAATVVLLVMALLITPKFAQIYKELGVQLPGMTEDVLGVWFHVLALFVLAAPCAWRFRAGSKSWATTVWFMLAALYVVLLVAALFMPLIGVSMRLGEQTN